MVTLLILYTVIVVTIELHVAIAGKVFVDNIKCDDGTGQTKCRKSISKLKYKIIVKK